MGTDGTERGKAIRDDREPSCPHEEGAVLLLTVIFVVIIALTLLGLLTLSGNDLTNTSNLQTERSLEYAADGATDAAVQAVRYSYYAFDGHTNKAGDDCLPDGPAFQNPDRNTTTMSIDGNTMMVDCTGTLPSPPGTNTRTVTFMACIQAQAPCTSGNSVLTATVVFQDHNSFHQYLCNSAPNSATCGIGVVVQSWVVKNANT
jgi:hypothetical protein